MAYQRTVQVLGAAYSTTGDVTMVCNIAGLGEVFNGVVPTINSAPPLQNTVSDVLFTFDVDARTINQIIASDITISNGTGYIAGIAANRLNPADWSMFIPLYRSAPDLKQDVRLDGVLLDMVEPDDGWHYEIPDGSTLAIDWNIRNVPRFVPGRLGHFANEIQAGVEYKIYEAGDTDWTAVGAANNNVGTIFTATGAGIGTGKAIPTQPMA